MHGCPGSFQTLNECKEDSLNSTWGFRSNLNNRASPTGRQKGLTQESYVLGESGELTKWVNKGDNWNYYPPDPKHCLGMGFRAYKASTSGLQGLARQRLQIHTVRANDYQCYVKDFLKYPMTTYL